VIHFVLPAEKLLQKPIPDSADRSSSPAPGAEPQETRRLTSLDAFRGLAVLGMLLVNNKMLGPWTPTQLTHSPWHGVHLADLVFPWFLLIVGVAVPFAASAVFRRGGSCRPYCWKVMQRAALLVFLGCLINSSYAKRPLFDLGVLQLLGLAYLVAALCYCLPAWGRGALAAALLFSHWALFRFLPLPGASRFAEEMNAQHYLNETYLAHWHLENLPALLTTSALVLIGTLLGDILLRPGRAFRRRLPALLGVSLGLVLAGWLGSYDLPFNKHLWTATFVIYTAGWGGLVLALFYWLMDYRGYRAWAFPLLVLGRNAITAFVLPILVNIYILRGWGWPRPEGAFFPLEQWLLRGFTDFAGAGLGGLLYTLGYLLFWWLILFSMYRRKMFLRI
jgi:predicted acyltransferase